jgi:photosystem II stability/assembly factor-like uncharacterized protein
VRRLAMAAPVVLPLVLLAGCTGAPQSTALSTNPRSAALTGTSTSVSPTTAIPSGFQAASVTFVSAREGWVLGSTTCVGDPSCTPILLRTEDAARTWTRVPLPPDSTVAQVRFADASDGWVWDNQSVAPDILHLWSTHDGGMKWQHPRLPGAEPGGASDVEAAAGLVSATVWSTTGSLVETSSVHTDNWRPSSVMLPRGAGGAASDKIVVAGTSGWLIDEDRGVLGGARLIDGAWAPWTPPCSQAGGENILLAASDSTHLAAVCDEAVRTGSPPTVHLYFSSDGGVHFQPAASSPPSFSPDVSGIASPAPGVVIMGGYGGDVVGTFDGGATWRVVNHQADSAVWLQVGFTSPSQGVAIDTSGTVATTFDGGRHWTPVAFHPPQP